MDTANENHNIYLILNRSWKFYSLKRVLPVQQGHRIANYADEVNGNKQGAICLENERRHAVPGSSRPWLFTTVESTGRPLGPDVEKRTTCYGSRTVTEFKCCMCCSVRLFVISSLCTVLIYINVGLAGFQIYCLSLVTVVVLFLQSDE